MPGRVNLIREHIDYHGLPVLPMAIGRGLHVAFRKRNDASVLCTSKDEPSECSFNLGAIAPGPEGDWTNYLKAAARGCAGSLAYQIRNRSGGRFRSPIRSRAVFFFGIADRLKYRSPGGK